MILRSELLILSYLLVSPSWAAETRASESSRPRGVGPEFAKFYKGSPPHTFTCISNPSISIPFSRVNDDFCDCPDGSDEPGTSACSYLSPLSPPQYHPGPDAPAGVSINSTPALPGFYCKNKGHVPAYLRFESVNDGKCDYDVCCDGSDEWASVGGIKCEDRCQQIGKEHRKIEEARQKSLRAALKRKSQLAAEAARLKKEVEMKIEDAEIKLKGFQINVKEAEENLKEVERREKLKVIRGQAGGKGGGKMGVLVGLAKSRIDELRSHLDKTRSQRDSMVARITELEGILASLKDEHNPNFNDDGVKRAVRGWEDYAARDTDDTWTEAEDRDLDAVIVEDSETNGINWAEFEDDSSAEAESDVAALYQFSAYLPQSLRIWLDETLSSFRKVLVENGILADTSSDSSATAQESKAVQDAKKTLSDAERDVRNAENDINRFREDLEKDYGPEGIFRALKDTCISKDSGEYEYELCFMSSTKQKPKKGGAHTGMGNFVGFDTEYVDEPSATDGKGLGTGERLVMKYENGQHCWNGPHRSTRVILACSENEEIWKVSESEKCVYRMEVGTAAVCESPSSPKKNSEAKVEHGGETRKDEL
ncbi:protein kinase C substrate 80K-H [Cladophialophora psammophila CBS 110553]|uniref:Glucosidase 2 subunit beta n=1 Tax=Cladophialophora psammophila CBS 110553 TaxID=1182543 RepID=W9WSJ2_9EURO|nr:protein kinase C substrate 80K-H [Cladophialophora psammophila CBS 110553]EXJ67975.1 protein kinase C substrate 80K-H [Cladophialophora psammophila CBS 110553]